MGDKLWFLLPEMVMFCGVCAAFIMGLSPSRRVRDMLPWVVCGFLAVAAAIVPWVYDGAHGTSIIEAWQARGEAIMLMPVLGKYVKIVVCVTGMILVLLSVGMVDRRLEAAMSSGRLAFDAMRANRGEFHAFFLLSLIGVNLVCSASDLIWLFLALELTSLPTYIMVAISRPSRRAQEAAVKYFFLGAMATALFLYGFALLYGSTGTMVLTEIQARFAEQASTFDGVNMLGIVGMILAVLGVSFKIAAAPMHFYAPDVYEGAASPVTAFLAFVPKTAGMLALILLLSTLGWSGHGVVDSESRIEVGGLPTPVLTTLWMIAVLTMTLGNIGAILQTSVKRVLAYSSIAHSGYMLIGIIAGPVRMEQGVVVQTDGLNAVLFYLLAYGLMNTAAFAVLASLERRGHEIESMDDLAGLRVRHPGMAVVMALASGSLLGVPPLLGFWGKFFLFVAGIQAGQIALVVIAGLNSAISAWYYLKLIALPIMHKPSAQSETISRSPFSWPRYAGILTAAAVVLLPVFTQVIFRASEEATSTVSLPMPPTDTATAEASPIDASRR